MSEQASGVHGPARDEAIKRQERDELAGMADEWPQPDADDAEDEDEDQPDATWAAEGRFAGEEWEAIELRSDLARHLDRTSFPTDRARLLQTLTERQAEQRLLDLASSLPGGDTYDSLSELVRALGLPVEERPG